MKTNISDIRKEYKKYSLHEADLSDSPFSLFEQWWKEVSDAKVEESNAMVLSTVDNNNQPHARIVLLKDFSTAGFTFFTNYLSDKGQQITQNKNVSLLFHWIPLERQVRICGQIHKIHKDASKMYFHSRPFGSQIAALASEQSQKLDTKEVLEEKYEKLYQTYKDNIVPYPSHWGGYIVQANSIEFWQGRPNRLHDRIHYIKQEDDTWVWQRLSP